MQRVGGGRQLVGEDAHADGADRDPFADSIRDNNDELFAVLKPGGILAGKYRIEGLIGAGGMGAVYRAVQLTVGRHVAIKVLQRQDAKSSDSLARFTRESVLLSRLQHPHVVTLHDYGVTDAGLCFLVLEHLSGRSLAAKIAPRIEPLRAVRIARQICEALAAAHREGIVHRDLKPSNVHLVEVSRDKDFVKLLDFGIAKLFTPNADNPITAVQHPIGTPRYMSPEQARSEVVDHRADIYALGCICFEMITGRAPFLSRDSLIVLRQHVHEPPPRFAEACPELTIDEQLESIVRTMLAKRPADRFQSADAAEAALGLWMAHAATEPVQSALRSPPRIDQAAHPATRPQRIAKLRVVSVVPVVETKTDADRDDDLELPTTAVVIEEPVVTDAGPLLDVAATNEQRPPERTDRVAPPKTVPLPARVPPPPTMSELDLAPSQELVAQDEVSRRNIETLLPPPADRIVQPRQKIGAQFIAAAIVAAVALAFALVAVLSGSIGRSSSADRIYGEAIVIPPIKAASATTSESLRVERAPADSTPTNAPSDERPVRLRAINAESGLIDSAALSKILRAREREIVSCFSKTQTGAHASRSLRLRIISSSGHQTIRAHPADRVSEQFASCVSRLNPPLGVPLSATPSINFFSAEIGPGTPR